MLEPRTRVSHAAVFPARAGMRVMLLKGEAFTHSDYL
jgi:hypothetical protein